MSATDGPGDVASRGPFSFLAGNLSDVLDLLERFSEILDGPSITEVSKEILNMPPEQRFTESLEVFKTIYGLEKSKPLNSQNREDLHEDISDFLDQFPLDLLFTTITQLWKHQLRESQEKALDRVVTGRRKSEAYVIVSVFLERLCESIDPLERVYYQKDDLVERLSPMTALFSRFYLIATGEQTEFTDDFLRDLVRASYYLSKLSGGTPDYDPEELTMQEVTLRVRQEGAIAVYENRDISVGRGAELAGVSTSQFETLLIQNGIVPRYGPAEGAALREGTGLSKSG